MKVLPLVFLLILTLSVLTIRQVETFKQGEILKKEYQDFLRFQDGKAMELRQRKLYNSESYHKTRKFNFRPFFDKEVRKKVSGEKLEQMKVIFHELVKVLYHEASFFKKIESKRPHFTDEILEAIIKLSDEEDKAFEGHIGNLARVKLPDMELQEAFYHMLKGTVHTLDKVEDYQAISQKHQEKSYKSLLDFLRDSALKGAGDRPERINLYTAPKELLLAIYQGNEAVVKSILDKQEELKKLDKQERVTQFKDFMTSDEITRFKHPLIKDDLLVVDLTPDEDEAD